MNFRHWLLNTALLLAASAVFGQNSVGLSTAFDREGYLAPLTARSADGTETALWDDDEGSSGWFFRINDTVVSPLDSGWVPKNRGSENSEIAVLSNRSFEFTWTTVISGDGSHARITGRFTNNSTETINAAPVLLLDTSLGEEGGASVSHGSGRLSPFRDSLYRAEIPGWIKTVRNSASPDLTVLFDGHIPSRPQRVVLANWMRMRQSITSFEPIEGRSFDNLPFSRGDSAILLDYRDARIGSGESAEWVILIGLDEFPPDYNSFESVVESTVSSDVENRRLREYTIRRRLREIDGILDTLETYLNGERLLDGEALDELEQNTIEQERLKSEYENL